MSEMMEVLLNRRSVRSYKPDMVPKEIIEQIVKAGTYAPTGMGKQAPIILAVTNREIRDRLSAMNAQIMGAEEGTDPFYGAPVVLVVLADKSIPTHVYDGSLVMGNLMNAAYAVGLGSCWIHRARQVFDSAEGKALLTTWGIPEKYIGVGHCILGYADGDLPAAKPRKDDYIVYA